TAPWVRRALEAGMRVIDLSADSRLDAARYAEWYGPHPHPNDLELARYGLVEAYRPDLPDARLVAAPGCNATAASLALLPFAAAGLLDREVPPVVTVVTGASGAGRATALPLHFSELDANARPYKPAGTHRHLAEIEGNLGRATEQGRWLSTHGAFRPLPVSFTPQLAPMVRGILATCTVRLNEELDQDAAIDRMRAYYEGEPMVHVQDALPEVKSVVGSDRTLLSVRHDVRTGLMTAFATIDNLGKGAAGQAVQGFNVAFGFPETTALEMEGRWP
ncbi:MAG: N-acetyl-gamma-glutamyl-phosphate reductase, partial [Trueperaceae bacterium]